MVLTTNSIIQQSIEDKVEQVSYVFRLSEALVFSTSKNKKKNRLKQECNEWYGCFCTIII